MQMEIHHFSVSEGQETQHFSCKCIFHALRRPVRFIPKKAYRAVLEHQSRTHGLSNSGEFPHGRVANNLIQQPEHVIMFSNTATEPILDFAALLVTNYPEQFLST